MDKWVFKWIIGWANLGKCSVLEKCLKFDLIKLYEPSITQPYCCYFAGYSSCCCCTMGQRASQQVTQIVMKLQYGRYVSLRVLSFCLESFDVCGCTFWCPKSFLGPKSVCLSMNFMCIIFCCCNLDHSVVLCSSDLAFYGIYGGTGILFGLLALWLEKMFVILVTSTVGSLAFFLGE